MSKSRRVKSSESNHHLDIEQFSYLAPNELPALILGIHVPHDAFRPDSNRTVPTRFKRGREWRKIAHEGHFWIGTRVVPTTDALMRITAFARAWAGTTTPLTLGKLNVYNDSLRRTVFANCDQSYSLLDSHQFPIDTVFLRDLTAEEFPADLDELVNWESGQQRAVCGGKWNLVILA